MYSFPYHLFHLFSIPYFYRKKNHVENVILHQYDAMLNENNNSHLWYESIMIIRVNAYSNNFMSGFLLWLLFSSLYLFKFSRMFQLVILIVLQIEAVTSVAFASKNIFIIKTIVHMIVIRKFQIEKHENAKQDIGQ